MRFGIISSTAIETPPSAYGGLELVSWLRAKGLAELGNEVTLVAAKGSKAPLGVSLLETVPVSVAAEAEEQAFKMYLPLMKNWDCVIDDSWQKHSYLAKMEDDGFKVMGVVHSPCPYRVPPPVRYPCFVGVSSAHAAYLSGKLNIPVRYVHHGLDLSGYAFQPDVSVRKRYLSLNRVMPEKNLHGFIQVIRSARALGDIAGADTRLVPDQSYVQRVRALSDGVQIRYWGEVSHEMKLRLLQNAKATVGLYSPPWFEVFGLWALESLASGTPILTLKGSGGPEEVIGDAPVGFVCRDLEEMIEVVKADKVSELKPEDCRARAEAFSYRVMSERYISLAKEAIEVPW